MTDAGDNPTEPESVLFKKQLTVKEPYLKSTTNNTVNIQELTQRINRARRKNGKVEKVKDASNLLKNLNRIREKSKQSRGINRVNKFPVSVNKPENWCNGDIDNSNNCHSNLVGQLQRVLEKSRAETTHAIMKTSSVNFNERSFIGIVVCVQILSDSLKLLDVYEQESPTVLYRVGLVCLWNEWVEIKKDDKILFQDLNNSLDNHLIQWCFKWKKLVGS